MNLKKKIFLGLSVCICITFFYRQFNSKLPDCTIVHNIKYFDFESSSYMLNKALVFKNGLISDIINENIALLKASCHVLDLNGDYMLPGLIDSHTHLLSVDREKVNSWRHALEISAARPDMMRLFLGEKNAKSMLYSGFTTARDLGNSGHFLDSTLRSRLQKKISVGPDLIISGPGITIRPSQINLALNNAEYTLIESTSDIDVILDKYKNYETDWVKLYADNSDTSDLIQQHLLSELTRKAKLAGFKVAIHAENTTSISRALIARPTSIEHFYKVPDIYDLNNSISTYAVLTDYSFKTCTQLSFGINCQQALNHLKHRVNWLKSNGFKIVFGSDAVLDFTSNFRNRGDAALTSLISLSESGLSPLEIINSATATAAEMLGINSGKIVLGKKANLVSYKEDPLQRIENLRTITSIFLNGEAICKNQKECFQ